MPSLSLMKNTFRPLLEFIYPPVCLVCDTRLEDGDSRVCPDCWSHCRDIAATDGVYRDCYRQLTANPARLIGDLISLYYFETDGAVQSIIHQVKYQGATRLGVELGRNLGEKILRHCGGANIDGIVPVPLHSTKLRERGYNQSEYLARGVHDVLGVPVCTPMLQRHRYTLSQAQLGAVERKENVRGAFRVRRRRHTDVEGKTFLVLDDVITTGATIGECAETLARAGARRIVVGSAALAAHSV